MRDTRFIMGMPVTLAILDASARLEDLERVFAHFVGVDDRFSPFKPGSELSRINRGEIPQSDYSPLMREIFALAEKTKTETHGYFDIRRPGGGLDPCGIVKGWAIRNAALLLAEMGFENFYVEAGGDIQTRGLNASGGEWRVGICSPFNPGKIVKQLYPKGGGVATSGTYRQGRHIYNPHAPDAAEGEIVSLTVIGPDILEADRYATAAFAMGREGICFIESLADFEGYEIDMFGMARMTSGLARHLAC